MNHRTLLRSSFAAALAAACSSPHASTESTPPGTPLLSYSTPRGGFVSAAVAVFGERPLLSVGAAFWAPDNAGAGVRCSAREVGRCSVRACEANGAPGRSLTSGVIALYADGDPVVLTPDERGHYENPAGRAHAHVWAEGARIHLETKGGGVPAFAADLTAPPPLDMLEPTAQSPLTLDRAAGFTARWTTSKPAEGDVRVAIRQEPAGGRTALEAGVAVDCFFPRDDGQGVVPPEALTDLSTALPASAMVYAVEQSRVRAGAFETTVLVNSGGVFRETTVQ